MRKFMITYRAGINKTVVVFFRAKTEDDAVVIAKKYRKDGFSIKDVKDQEGGFQ